MLPLNQLLPSSSREGRLSSLLKMVLMRLSTLTWYADESLYQLKQKLLANDVESRSFTKMDLSS